MNLSLRKYSVIALAWLVLQIMQFIRSALFGSFDQSFAIIFQSTTLGLLLIPAVLFITNKFSTRIKSLILVSLLHLGISIIIPFVLGIIFEDTVRASISGVEMLIKPSLIFYFFSIYLYIATFTIILHIIDTLKTKETKNAILEKELATAQLINLKSQIRPHFLFNTLHGINQLMETDVATAQDMMVNLSSLLRRVADTNNEQFISLEEEFSFARDYLEIEEVRFKDRLKIEYEMDPDSLYTKIPAFIIQPLIENALKHGISNVTDNGLIRITTSKNKNRVFVRIEDNAALLEKDFKEGVGTSNIKARLENIYGNEASFKLFLHNNFTVAELSLPFEEYESTLVIN